MLPSALHLVDEAPRKHASADAAVHLGVHLIKVRRLRHGMPVWHREVGGRDVGRACTRRAAQVKLEVLGCYYISALDVVSQHTLHDAASNTSYHQPGTLSGLSGGDLCTGLSMPLPGAWAHTPGDSGS